MTQWPDDTQILAQFREWLDVTRTDVAALPDEATAENADPDGRSVGLYSLLEQMTALRHEVKLQTKSARRLQEQNEKSIAAIEGACASLARAEPQPGTAAEGARAALAALIDLDEALERGRGALDAARQRIIEQSAEELAEMRTRLDALFDRQSWWRRRLCRPWHEATKAIYFPQAIENQQDALAALLDGYTLIQTRLKKALVQLQVRRIECVGQPADPRQMTVVEAVDDPYLPPGQVIEELRPGYLWRGDVFRFAEVKAARQR